MSYQEIKNLVSILAGFIILAAYILYLNSQYSSGAASTDDLLFAAQTMLRFIAIGVGVAILLQILFHILYSVGFAAKEYIQAEAKDTKVDDKAFDRKISGEMKEDERDRLVGLRASSVSYVLVGVGFLAGLLVIVMDYSVVVMLNIFFLSFLIASIVEGFVQIYLYRRN
ncbi:MAG: hypothetical protein QY318_03150 [Candidatus Dojkabacteria bacterium]|nr:MAG: hypothetical protein QY318_03150 [Candidatus Dojkabacteria bacterium]